MKKETKIIVKYQFIFVFYRWSSQKHKFIPLHDQWKDFHKRHFKVSYVAYSLTAFFCWSLSI